MRCWNEVPEDHYEFLKKRILEAIINYAMGPKIVLNRLCIAVSFHSKKYFFNVQNVCVKITLRNL